MASSCTLPSPIVSSLEGLWTAREEVPHRFSLTNPLLEPKEPNHKTAQVQTKMQRSGVNAADFRPVFNQLRLGFVLLCFAQLKRPNLIRNDACPLWSIAHTSKKYPR
jgi:hypothetical protein